MFDELEEVADGLGESTNLPVAKDDRRIVLVLVFPRRFGGLRENRSLNL